VLENSSVERLDLLPYHDMAKEKYQRIGKPYMLQNGKILSIERIQGFKDILIQMGFDVVIGG